MNLEGRPSLCRQCGAIVGAGQTSCAVCGADVSASPPTAGQPRRSYDRDALRFARAVLSRSYIFTILFLVANLFVFLLMWQSSGMSSGALWEFPAPVLLAYGAKLNYLIKQDHQWWRFVTPVFIHVNLPHLLINMYSLWMIGPYVEKLYGSAKFVVFWVVTGVAGLIASYLTVRPGLAKGPFSSFIFKANDYPSAGASGALFGLVGVLFVFGIKFRRELPEGFKRAFGTGLLPIILINLFIGFLGRGLFDNAAHLGGLVSGAALALVIDYKRPGERATITITWRTLQILSLALVAVSFFMVARHFRADYAGATKVLQPTSADQELIPAYFEALNKGMDGFVNLTNHEMDAKAAQELVQSLDQVAAPDEQAKSLLTEIKTLILRAQELETIAPAERARAKTTEQRKKLYAEFEAWIKQRDQWVATLGTKYGAKLVPPKDANNKSSTDQETPPVSGTPPAKK